MLTLQSDRHMKPVRRDPRYRDLVTRLGIPTHEPVPRSHATTTLSGIPKGEQRQITLSVNDLRGFCVLTKTGLLSIHGV